MNRTWNQYVVKQENKTLVLSTIIDQTPISRASVAQVTGLNKGTVSSLVSELIDEELVEESGPGESNGGRRPVMLLFNGKAGYSLAIDLGVDYLLGAIIDLNGNIIYEEKRQLQSTDFDVVFPFLTRFINHLMEQVPKSRYGIIGIGVGVPAVISHQGEILLAPNLNWKKIKLKEQLEQQFNIPIYIENEANAGAYGEMRYGFEQMPKHMVYASIGIGIGVGMILDGQLYNGLNGFAGEAGHMTVVKDGRTCRCGNLGCWERYASEQALIDEAVDRQLIEHNQVEPFQKLIELANQQNQAVINLFEEIGTYIGIGLTNTINIFNPEHVVIGNQLIDAEQWISPAIGAYINKHAIGFHQNDLKISFAKLQAYSTVRGMAAFTIEGFLLKQRNA
ncbi:ROK family transcriptional regulator [Amphibacillus cookii]|uniref:ROK family transcriptional regulator n=1 Tax=Amphibacillus cookii TaxID=767787 RepID=UPI0019569774|nr:ROK family transcriptional regulator [Amphibacillus cookii]MBM7541600.1 putative NBD/HSP70 family sugar kinase [Amphibacillus cookii]